MRTIGKIAFASVSLLALATPALAQDASEEDGFSSNEIIVAARRKDESVQDVPLVVQAVTSAQLQNLEIRQFEDVTRAVPGLQLAANANGLGTTASIRGVNFDANASGAATTVEFYRNDAVITSGALFQAVYDVGQIEVLRGPQGTLRGRASPSGSITLTTRRPDLSEVGGYASGSVTDNHRWNVNGAINVPILADKLAVRVAGFNGESRGNDISGMNLITRTVDDNVWDHVRAIRSSVRADPFDGILVLDFNYEAITHKNRQYDQVESWNNVVSTVAASPVKILPEDRMGVGAAPRTTDQNYQIYNWQAQLRLLGQQLTYVGSKISGKINAYAPQDAAGLFGSAVPLVPSTTDYAQVTSNNTRQETHEIRLQNEERIAGLFSYVIGGMRQSSNSPSFLNNLTTFASPTAVYYISNLGLNRYREDKEDSLFGNVTLHLGERLELSGGMRRIWFHANSGVQTGTYGADPSTYVEATANRRCYGNPDIPGCLPTKATNIYSAVAKYNVNDDIMVYASYGTSWRPGNSVIGFRGAAVGDFLSQFLNLPDETSKSYEIGLKSSWLDNRVRFNVSAYSQEFSNYAYRVSSPVLALSAPTTVRADAVLAAAFNFVAPVPAKIKGFEAELAFDVSENLYFSTTVSFADGKITDGVFPCLDVNKDNVPDTGTPPTAQVLWDAVGANQVGTCTADASPSSSARWAGTFQGEYSRAINDSTEGYLRGFVNWKGDSNGFTLNPYDQVEAYALVDLFLGVRDPDGAWDLGLFAKNLLNTHRVTFRTDNAVSSPLRPGTNLAAFGGTGTSINTSNSTNYLQINTNDPREFGVSFRMAFGSR